MKKIQLILLAAVLLVTLSGCGNQNIQSTTNQANNTTIVSSNNTKEKDIDVEKNTISTNENKTENSTNQDSNKTIKGSDNNVNYEMTDEVYTKQNIKITYPQLKNPNNSKKIDSINKILKDQALAVTNYYDLSNPNALLKVSYNIQFQANDTLSIVYKGDYNSGSSAYPVSVFYSTNINTEEGKNLRLKDYANVNEIFNKLRKSNSSSNIAATKELAQAQTEYISTIDDSTLKGMLENADFYESNGTVQFPEVFSYRNSDGIVIGIPVPHAIGDYAEFVMKK